MKILLFFTSIVVVVAVSVAMECWGPDVKDMLNKNCTAINSDTVDTAKCVKHSCESQGKCVLNKVNIPAITSSITTLGGCITPTNGCHKWAGSGELCLCDTNLCNAAKATPTPNAAKPKGANAASGALECWGPDYNDILAKPCMAISPDNVDTAKCVKKTCESQGKCLQSKVTEPNTMKVITILGGCFTPTNGCHDIGDSKYCLCDTNLCNAAKPTFTPTPLLTGVGVTVAGLVAILYR